jgi:hypothetical protein
MSDASIFCHYANKSLHAWRRREGACGARRLEFAGKLSRCRLARLGQGVHFLQEDHPETIGREVSAFIAEAEGLRDDERKARGLPCSTLIDPAHRSSRSCDRSATVMTGPAKAGRRQFARSGYFAPSGANIGLPLAVTDAGVSSCMTSQCSATLPSASRKMSTAIIGFGPQPM